MCDYVVPNLACKCDRCEWYRNKDAISISEAMPYVQEIVAIFYQWVNNYHRQNPIPFSLFDLILREDGSGKIKDCVSRRLR